MASPALRVCDGRHSGDEKATPDQFDLERGLWIIPPAYVKQLKLQMRRKRQRPESIPPYIVPLSAQAIELVRYVLAQFKPLQHYLFRGAKNIGSRISENTLNNEGSQCKCSDLICQTAIGTVLRLEDEE